MSLGPAEILVVLVLALIVFGPKKLPEVGRQIGGALRELRKMQASVEAEVRSVIDDHVGPTATMQPNPQPPLGEPIAPIAELAEPSLDLPIEAVSRPSEPVPPPAPDVQPPAPPPVADREPSDIDRLSGGSFS
ncbi:MAG TPA: twin-arginine translocase TatA/TatE family subunit [Acidimicrobiia bacterium]|jgi:sec-independent protein translocase protein TatA|nr:twin-arginine translocase TatA/TatE family subunit [Acidimicrobiia bacterium]